VNYGLLDLVALKSQNACHTLEKGRVESLEEEWKKNDNRTKEKRVYPFAFLKSRGEYG